MNEKRETANTGMQQAIPGFDGGYRPIRRRSGQAPAGVKIPCFFTKSLHKVQTFCEKDKRVPRCRRRIGLSSDEMGPFGHAPRNSCE
jgi:hypothetical protein